jgi:hypothetical protein
MRTVYSAKSLDAGDDECNGMMFRQLLGGGTTLLDLLSLELFSLLQVIALKRGVHIGEI